MPLATGQSLSALLRQNDARRLAAALTHLAHETFADEELRRCVLGLRFKGQGQGHEDEEGGVTAGGNGCRGTARLPALAVEVVPCGGGLLGKRYFLFALPPADDSSPAAIFRALRYVEKQPYLTDRRALNYPKRDLIMILRLSGLPNEPHVKEGPQP